MSYLDRRTFRLDRAFYSPKALFDSIERYADLMEVQVSEISKSGCDVMIRVKPEFCSKEQTIKAEFLNYLLGDSILAKDD